MIRSLKLLAQRFAADQRGNILMIFGVSFLFLVAVGGAGYDLGRQQLVRLKIQQAADAAALAAAGMEYGTADNDRKSLAQLYFTLNYPTDYLGVARPSPSISIVPNMTVTVAAEALMPTSFVRTVGVQTVNAKGRSVTQIKADYNKVDLILVLDNSGSMGANRDVGSNYSQDAAPGVRGKCIAGWIAYYAIYNYPLSAADANGFCNRFEGATGFTRLNALRYSATKLVDDLMDADSKNNRISVITWDYFLMESQVFTNNESSVKSFLSQMYGRGATNSTYGLSQAQKFASSFRSDAIHAVVLMTDGQNASTAGTPEQQAAETAASNAASLEICKKLKEMPRTLVFTIAFGNETLTRPIALQFLSDCATGPNGTATPKPNENLYYYPAADADQLQAAFKQIAGNLKKVRIIQ